MKQKNLKLLFSLPVIVASLGYFVDIYDLLLFSIVRKASLSFLGVPDAQLLEQGEYLLRMQMAGLLFGGIIWGVMGDKKGRLSVLFGSILLYSLANIANGFATTVDQYAWLRLIAGIGLAGELGAGVTLVSETLPTNLRGYATAIIASVGLMGHNQRLKLHITPHQLRHRQRQRGHNAANRYTCNCVEAQTIRLQEIAQQHSVFVGHLVLYRARPP